MRNEGHGFAPAIELRAGVPGRAMVAGDFTGDGNVLSLTSETSDSCLTRACASALFCQEADGSFAFRDAERRPYLSSDRRHCGERCLGRGEVWVKGANLASGYYTEEAMTKKEFDEDG